MQIKSTLKRESILIDGKLIKASLVATKLMEKSNLKHSFSIGKVHYIYSGELGIYFKLNEDRFQQAILLFLAKLDLHPYITKNYITDIAWFVQLYNLAKEDISYDYLTFKNGCLRLTDLRLLPYSPEYKCISRVEADYSPDLKPEKFQALLDLNFEQDAQEFLKAFMRSALMGDNRAQVFLYIIGPGGTGKSTIVNILTMVVGKESTLTTTFRDLAVDKFEGLNLIGKRLICINDTETFKGDLSVVKAITGGDSILGREKHKSGSYEVIPRGLMVVTGNGPLQSRDVSGAIARRIRVLPMKTKPDPSEIKPLIYKIGDSWGGPLVDESPGIIKWCHMDQPRAYQLLVDPSLTPSLLPARDESIAVLNPMSGWIKELDSGPGHRAYVGVIPAKQDYLNLINVAQSKRTLYPAYLIYCHKRGLKPLSHNNFTNDLVMACDSLNIPIRKAKDRYGAYIDGLSINIDRLVDQGAPDSLSFEAVNPEDSKIGQNEQQEISQVQSITEDSKTLNLGKYEAPSRDTYKAPSINPSPILSQNALVWRTRNPDVYNQYYDLLAGNKLKDSLNMAAKDFNPDINDLMDEHVGMLSGLEGFKVQGLDYDFGKPSEEYKRKTRDIFQKGIVKVNNQLIPYRYKPMGLSPRILPQAYGQSFNSVKRFVREKAYKFLQNYDSNYVVLDIDLKSCYTAILLGLFPVEMNTIRQAIEGEGLWKYIEKEFKRSGRSTLFNKPAAKICVYSSFFCGGPKAMINGTLDFMRKEIGLTPAEFRKADFYEALHALAREVSQFMNRSSVIQDFRRISGYVSKDYNNMIIKGPTDHEYMIDAQQFQSSYPNFLQSFEFYLLAQATIQTIPHFDAHLIGHFHDGNVVYISKTQKSDYIQLMNENLDKLRNDLTLNYPQIIEVKEL